MQYFGGKAKLAPKIVPVIQSHITPEIQGYWEPFCGALNTFSRVVAPVKVASDANEALIELYWHVKLGGELPEFVSEEDYARAKRGDAPLWYQAFVGFGCSFAGKYFGGYARGVHGADAKTARSSLGKKARNYALNSKNSLSAKPFGDNTIFIKGAYDCVYPFNSNDGTPATPNGPWVYYCDPPYAGTTGYAGCPPWDVDAFWTWTREQARAGHTVLVSEYAAPPDIERIAAWPHRTEIRTPKSGDQLQRVEALFRVPSA